MTIDFQFEVTLLFLFTPRLVLGTFRGIMTLPSDMDGQEREAAAPKRGVDLCPSPSIG